MNHIAGIIQELWIRLTIQSDIQMAKKKKTQFNLVLKGWLGRAVEILSEQLAYFVYIYINKLEVKRTLYISGFEVEFPAAHIIDNVTHVHVK